MPDTVALFPEELLSTPKLPKDVPDPALHYRRMKISQGGDEAPMLVAYGRYKLWKGQDSKVRWAEISWPDDGLGICGHGAGKDLVEAIQHCYEHKQLRENK